MDGNGWRRFLTPLFGPLIFLLWLPAICNVSARGEPRANLEEASIVTAENSPQFAKDCGDIDNLRCLVLGLSPGGINANIAPQDAGPAHSLLKRLLAEHSLRRDFDLPSSEHLIVDEHVLHFVRGPKSGDAIFSSRFFLEGLVELVYHPADKPKDEPIAAVFQLDKRSEAEYYSVLADCLAESNPEESRKFWWKAAAIRFPSRFGCGILVLTVLVTVLSIWISRRKRSTASGKSPEGGRDEA